MATTTVTDVIVPEILTDAIAGAFDGMTALSGTPAVVVNTSMPNGARAGDKIKVPRFDNIGEMDDLDDGEAITPVKLTMDKDEATVQRSGKGFETTGWANLAAAYADPYAEAARQLRIGVARRIDKALIDEVSTVSYAQEFDASDDSISYDMIVDALGEFGDEEEADGGVLLFVCHSAIKRALRKIKDSNGNPIFEDAREGLPPKVLGIPVRTSDRMTKTGTGEDTVYTSGFVKRAAMAAWVTGRPEPEPHRDPARDVDALYVNIYWCVHVYRRLSGTKTGVCRLKSKA